MKKKEGKIKVPIESMIDSVVRCTKCGVKGVGNCNCWNKPKKERRIT